MTELWRLSAAELAARIRRREVSAREAAQAALDRLDAVNPRINAVVDHRPDDVLRQADAIDQRTRDGGDPGPLAGVPVTIKTNTDQAGYATSNGLVLQRDQVAAANSPVVDNLRRAGAVILGRTNTPAFSLRWFTDNRLHGATRNPRDPALTPGGSSGGAAAAVATGIGHLAQGTDIAGSVRYPAYACGVHGLRPSLGRVAQYNASTPERLIGPQIMSTAGPIGRTIGDLRLGLAAMSGQGGAAQDGAAQDWRDPWWMPAPLEGPAAPRRVSLCLRPNGMAIVPEVEAALLDAARRLGQAGYVVTPIDDTPSWQEATDLQLRLWLGDGFAGQWDLAQREGDPGALTTLTAFREFALSLPVTVVADTLQRRATLTREWLAFMAAHTLLLVPVSGELPFADGLDLQGDAAFRRIWAAQLVQSGLPLMGLPGLTVSTGLVGATPVGVQIIGERMREDLCLLAGEAIEAGGTPPSPIDPA